MFDINLKDHIKMVGFIQSGLQKARDEGHISSEMSWVQVVNAIDVYAWADLSRDYPHHVMAMRTVKDVWENSEVLPVSVHCVKSKY